MRKLKLFMTALALTGGLNVALAQTDVTSTYLTNAGFDDCTAETSNVAAKTIKDYSTSGWTNTNSGSYTTLAVTSYGSNVKVGDSTTPSTKKDGTTVSGNTLGIIAGWADVVKIQSGDITLPAGVYTLTVDHYLTSSTSNYGNTSSSFGFVTSGNSYTISSTTFTASTWTTETVNFILTESTTGKIQIGLTGLNKTGSGSPAVFYDDVTLTKYSDDDLREINGLTSATYANPIVTDFVVNGTFDSNVNGWNRTGGFQNNNTANNQQGAFTGNFYENWNGSAKVNKMYQTITNIPNGTYRLDICAFVNTLADPNESQYVFANNDKTYLTTGEPTAYEVYTVVTNNQVEVGLEQTTATANWMGIDNVSLRYYGAGDVINDAQNASHKLAWEEAKAAAEAAIANADFANVTGSEKTALQAEIAKAEPTTADGYDEAAAALNAATATFTAAAPAYNELIAEIAYAKTIAIATETAEAALNANATAATVTAATQELKVSEYQGIKADYPNDVTSMFGTWAKGSYDTTNGQGYAGSESYFDKWNGSALDLTSSNTAKLPAGKYAVMVAGRGVSTTTMNLSVKVGDAEAVSTPFLMNGDTGKGIDTDGATNFSDNGTYSNGNNGRGWQYRYITFETDGTANVTIAINGHLNAGTWQSFYAPVILCDGETYAAIALDAAKAELQAAIDAAPAVPEANVGNGVFQFPTAGVNTYADAIDAAHDAHDATDATVESINQAKADLEAAVEAFNALEVNAPANGTRYYLTVATADHAKVGNAIVVTLGSTSANNPTGYGFAAAATPNRNFAQAFIFTKVSGNNYKISVERPEGTVYLTYGSLNGSAAGWKTQQIQGTTDASAAGEFKIVASTTENAFNIVNTVFDGADNFIDCQDGGALYTDTNIDKKDFSLTEASKAEVNVSISSTVKYGTRIFPFTPTLPAGVKAYSCEAAEGKVLTLAEVETPAANTPYILENTNNNDVDETLTGWGVANSLKVTAGWLTGVYESTSAPVGSYVLQNNDDKVGFYVVEEIDGKVPTVGAYRCYLTKPAAEGARAAYFFSDNETTGISAIEALTAGDAQIFNAAGAQQPRLQKGMNIIRKADGTSYKVMVK